MTSVRNMKHLDPQLLHTSRSCGDSSSRRNGLWCSKVFHENSTFLNSRGRCSKVTRCLHDSKEKLLRECVLWEVFIVERLNISSCLIVDQNDPVVSTNQYDQLDVGAEYVSCCCLAPVIPHDFTRGSSGWANTLQKQRTKRDPWAMAVSPVIDQATTMNIPPIVTATNASR